MFKFSPILILAIGLIVFFTTLPLAADQGQPAVVKVYKSPG